MFLTQVHRIAVDTSGSDLGTTPPLNSLVDADNDGSIVGDKGAREQYQQEVAEGTAGPVARLRT
jgi:hypothetical protein